VILGVVLVLCVLVLDCLAEPKHPMNIIPYGIRFPMVRSAPYVPPMRLPYEPDPYERTFGIRRPFVAGFGPLQSYSARGFRETFAASRDWDRLYGSYGVLGRGQEVFSRKAAAWRATHRGR